MRRPPELASVFVAAAGAFALAVGLLALLDGRLAGALIALGGVTLLAWSVVRRRG